MTTLPAQNWYTPLRKFKLTLYTHFFKITEYTPQISAICLRLAHDYTHRGIRFVNGKPERQVLGTYAGKTATNSEYRFHIGQLEDFMRYLAANQIAPDDYERVSHPLYDPEPASIELDKGITPYDYQEEAISFVMSDDPLSKSRLVAMPTGTGKGTVSLAVASRLKQRVLVFVLAKYTKKWADEIIQKTSAGPKDVMIVKGSSQLQGLIQQAREGGYVAPFTIISLNTHRNYITNYEGDPNDALSENEYGILPEALFEVLKTGLVIVDESHEHLFSVYKLMLYCHAPKFLALSATFIDRDPFIQHIQKVMFPKEMRFDKIKMKKYIEVYAFSYNFRDIERSHIRTTEHGQNTYSHTAFEKSILKNKNPYILKNYFELIDYVVNMGYVAGYKPGDKLAVYCATIDMCSRLTDYFKKKYPHLDSRKYVEGAPLENAILPDIRVTTIISGGTAIDIPGLRCVINTISIDSPKANIQLLGRLRELKDRNVKHYYLYCETIKKQIDFHLRRKELYLERALFVKDLRVPVIV